MRTHAYLLRRNLLLDACLASSLFSLYASLWSPAFSLRFCSSITRPYISLYNHAVRTLSKSPSPTYAVALYARMTREGVAPDNFTYPFVFNACAANSSLLQGQEVHSRVVRSGYANFVHVGNSLVDMYGKCGQLCLARAMFEDMSTTDVVSLNALLGAHVRTGAGMYVVRSLFDKVANKNVISWNAMVVGYANAGDSVSAREMFDAMPVRNIVSWNTMILGYAKSGLIDEARALFDVMPERNLVTWAALISGYAQNGRPHEALQVFYAMEDAGFKPDAAVMIGVIASIAQLGDSKLAVWVESYVNKNGIEKNHRILTALVDMHGKCGNLEEACLIFEDISSKDTFCYTALINALASHGHSIEALKFFHRMEEEGIRPDGVTYVSILNACSHTGLVEEGLAVWDRMVNYDEIVPKLEHFACLVGLLGRAGRLREAYKIVLSMATGPHAGALGALLSACRDYGETELAEVVANQLFELEPENTGNYTLLWDLYASKGDWNKAAQIRRLLKAKGIRKLCGSSWV